MKNTIATHWLARGRSIPLGKKPLLMGIANLTPDSFSEHPLFAKQATKTQSVGDVPSALDTNSDCDEKFQVDENVVAKYVLKQVRDRASRVAAPGPNASVPDPGLIGIVDLGAESTSPGSKPVSPDEQLRRLLPSVKLLAQLDYCPISVDTTSSVVARQVLEAGAMIINDISGGTFDPEMIDVVRHYEAGVCLGHIQGTPETMQAAPHYDNVVAEIREYLASRRDEFMKKGVPSQSIAVDPGLGFGKTQEHNNEIVLHADEFRIDDSVLLFGHSRKSFLFGFCNKVLEFGEDFLYLQGDDTEFICPGLTIFRNGKRVDVDRLTAFVTELLTRKGVDVLRVHEPVINFSAVLIGRKAML